MRSASRTPAQRCGSSRRRSSRQLRRADQDGAPSPAADPHQAAHVGPGRSAAAALASSLPALDPLQDAQQRGHRAHALRISTGSSSARQIRPATVPGCGILTRRPTLAQGEAQRRPLPLPSPCWILSRMRSSEATRPRRCGSAPAAAAPSFFVPTVDTGRSKTTLEAQEVNCRLDK